jgi:hypothetical protein
MSSASDEPLIGLGKKTSRPCFDEKSYQQPALLVLARLAFKLALDSF